MSCPLSLVQSCTNFDQGCAEFSALVWEVLGIVDESFPYWLQYQYSKFINQFPQETFSQCIGFSHLLHWYFCMVMRFSVICEIFCHFRSLIINFGRFQFQFHLVSLKPEDFLPAEVQYQLVIQADQFFKFTISKMSSCKKYVTFDV